MTFPNDTYFYRSLHANDMNSTYPVIGIKDVVPYANNPRVNDDTIPFLANSIHDFGFLVPIVIDKDKTIVAGHTRILACEELLKTGDLGYWGPAPKGMSPDDPEYTKYQALAPNVYYIDASSLSDEQVAAYRLADNRVQEMSGWDLEKLDICLQPLSDIIDMERFGFIDMGELEVYDGEDNSIELPDINVGGSGDDEAGLKLMVYLDDPIDAEDLRQRLTEEGYRCKVF